MRVLFLYVSTNMCRDGNLWFYDEGLASAAAVMAERGHDYALRMVDEYTDEADVLPWIESNQVPGKTLLVFLTSIHFSAYGHDMPNTFERVKGLRQRTGLPTMFTGLWATLNSADLLDHDCVDMVGRGEMDYALADVCDALEQGATAGGIPNIWTQAERPELRPLLHDLDALPFPARDILPVESHANERDGILTVVGSRGCPMTCEFCTHVVVRRAYGDVSAARYMRTKSVGYLVEEIRAARERMPHIWGLYFHDDMFLLSKSWREEFFARYPSEVGLPFGCNLVIDQIRPELIRELGRVGCSHVLVGIESGSERMRTRILNKPLRDEKIEAALQLCRDHGIRVKFYALLGAPEESRRDLLDSFKGFGRYCADMVQVQVWMAHETSDLLAMGRRAAEIARNQYDPRADRDAWRLKFYFHFFHRYVAIYHLLGDERKARLRARLVRAFVTLSVRLPFAPELLMTKDWHGAPRWPRHLRFVGRLAVSLLGGFGKRLRGDLADLEMRLAGDYIKPAGVATPADGWREHSRVDRRLTKSRTVAVG